MMIKKIINQIFFDDQENKKEDFEFEPSKPWKTKRTFI